PLVTHTLPVEPLSELVGIIGCLTVGDVAPAAARQPAAPDAGATLAGRRGARRGIGTTALAAAAITKISAARLTSGPAEFCGATDAFGRGRGATMKTDEPKRPRG